MSTFFMPVITRWKIATATPHRPMFLAGAIQLIAVMLFWSVDLAGRAGILLERPFVLAIPSLWAHVLLMTYGLFAFFIYGFLFTVFPRWMGDSEVPRRHYMTVWTLAVLGIVVSYAGLFLGRSMLASGLAIYLSAWLVAIVVLSGVYRRCERRRVHELLLLVELGAGAVGLGIFIAGVIADRADAFGIARTVGLWGYLVPVLLTVCHRMIPFFTQSALPFMSVPRPQWSLAVFVGGIVLHGTFEWLALPAATLVVDATLAGVALHHSLTWSLRRSFSVRLLAMLHVAFLWFAIAMALYAIQAALLLGGIAVLGRAPLHALAIGFITGTLIAMATRVTLGHSGQALAVKAPTWYLFLALSVGVTLLRVAAEVFPVLYQAFNLLAAVGWLLLLIPWAARYAPIYWRPRADGRPG